MSQAAFPEPPSPSVTQHSVEIAPASAPPGAASGNGMGSPLPMAPVPTDVPPPNGSPAVAAGQSQAPDAGPRVPRRMLDELDLRSTPPVVRRRIGLPLILFVATCFTTFYAGVLGWRTTTLDVPLSQQIAHEWPRGLTYMLAVMAVLFAHEMGHFLMTLRHRIPSSFPLFIPMPFGLSGTMGAVISMDGLRANRRQLFDIGIAGPLAGLVLTVPLVCYGIRTAQLTPPAPGAAVEDLDQKFHFGQPLLVKLLLPVLRPEWPEGAEFEVNAIYMAGWFGMLITGLNMMPVSQLDGGHVIFALFRQDGRRLARMFLIGAIATTIISDNYFYAVMLVLVILLGVDHPRTADDHMPLGRVRWAIGLASLVIPILCFTPKPI